MPLGELLRHNLPNRRPRRLFIVQRTNRGLCRPSSRAGVWHVTSHLAELTWFGGYPYKRQNCSSRCSSFLYPTGSEIFAAPPLFGGIDARAGLDFNFESCRKGFCRVIGTGIGAV